MPTDHEIIGQAVCLLLTKCLSPPAPASADPAATLHILKILKGIDTMSDQLTKLLSEQTKLQADVAAQTTVIASATTALTGLTSQLAAAEAAAKAAGVTDEQIAGFTSVRATLESNTAALAAAIPANTPAAEQPTAVTTASADPAAPSGPETVI